MDIRLRKLTPAILLTIGLLAAVYCLLYYLSQAYCSSYHLLMNVLMELTITFIAFAIFCTSWLLHDNFEDKQEQIPLLLGIPFITIGWSHLLHVLSFPSLPFAVPLFTANPVFPPFFFARLLLVVSLPAAVYFRSSRAGRFRPTARWLLVVSLLSMAVIFMLNSGMITLPLQPVGRNNPAATLFFLGFLLFNIWLLLHQRHRMKPSLLLQLICSVSCAFASELSLLLSHYDTDVFKLTSYIFRISSCAFMYRAVCVFGMIRPAQRLRALGQMSVDLLSPHSSLDEVLKTHIIRLQKLILKADRVSLYRYEGQHWYRALYVAGYCSDILGSGHRLRIPYLVDDYGRQVRILDNAAQLLENVYPQNEPSTLPPFLAKANHYIYIPLLLGDTFYGFFSLSTFSRFHRFTLEDLDNGLIFQQFALLAIEYFHKQNTFHRLSHEDNLTGLANRRHFFDALAQTLRQAGLHAAACGIILLNIIDLKSINDRWGHAAGDEALQIISRKLKEQQTQGGLPARLGGDEFAIIYPDLSQAGLHQKIDHLRSALTNVFIPSVKCTLTVAIGGASFPAEAADADSLLTLSAEQMHEHKRLLKQSMPS